MRVQVYRNLRTGGFSIRDKRTRRVIDRAPLVVLEEAVFKVSPKGNARARAQKQRNVHAWVEGERSEDIPAEFETWPVAYYNPFKVTQFVDPDGRPILGARRVVLHGDCAYYEE